MGQNDGLVNVVARLLLTDDGIYQHTIGTGSQPGSLHHPLMPGMGYIAGLESRYFGPAPPGQLLAQLARCEPEAIKRRIDPGWVDQSKRTSQETILIGCSARHTRMG